MTGRGGKLQLALSEWLSLQPGAHSKPQRDGWSIGILQETNWLEQSSRLVTWHEGGGGRPARQRKQEPANPSWRDWGK